MQILELTNDGVCSRTLDLRCSRCLGLFMNLRCQQQKFSVQLNPNALPMS